jgi:hypothetical protein
MPKQSPGLRLEAKDQVVSPSRLAGFVFIFRLDYNVHLSNTPYLVDILPSLTLVFAFQLLFSYFPAVEDCCNSAAWQQAWQHEVITKMKEKCYSRTERK